MAEEFENINVQPEDQEPKAESFKEKAEELKENIADKAEELKENIADKADDFKEKAEEFKEKAKEKAEEAKEKAEEAYEKVKSEIDDVTDEIDPEDIKKNKIYAILAYIGILVVIPIFAAKDSKFARFHANQGLIIFLIELVASIFLKKWLLGIIGMILFIFAVMGIIYAVQGKAKELPLIGNIKILK